MIPQSKVLQVPSGRHHLGPQNSRELHFPKCPEPNWFAACSWRHVLSSHRPMQWGDCPEGEKAANHKAKGGASEFGAELTKPGSICVFVFFLVGVGLTKLNWPFPAILESTALPAFLPFWLSAPTTFACRKHWPGFFSPPPVPISPHCCKLEPLLCQHLGRQAGTLAGRPEQKFHLPLRSDDQRGSGGCRLTN